VTADLLSIVRNYIALGWAPVPIPHRQKGPLLDAWQDLRVNAETAATYFNGAKQNIGVILGKASGGLTDVDLDCPEAIAAAGYILPRTAVFGHASKPASHWVYRTNLCETQDRAALKFMGSDKTGLLEVRMGAGGLAAQTVFPPSTHVSGEPIEWVDRGPGEIAEVDGAELVISARRLAAAAELARNYPKVGGRHDAAFVLGGFLTRCGFTPPRLATFVEAVGAASLQPGDKRRDMARTARDGAGAAKRAGFPALAETFGEGPAKKVAEWFGYAEAQTQGEGRRARPDSGSPPLKRIEVIMGSDVKPEAIAWLWPGWLAHGKLHFLAGRPGTLKTTTALSLAAAVTVGGNWPDGWRAAPGIVIIWSGEDAVADTLLPRLIAAGGDPAQVAFISGVEEDGRKRSFDPAADMDTLIDLCDRMGSVNLVIIDPIVAVAKSDSHKNAETRRDLQPLVNLAEHTRAAVFGIHHLTKRSEDADPVDRISGSLAFGAGPRVVLLSTLDREAAGEPRGVIMRAKNNIGPSHGGIEFGAEMRTLDAYPGIAAQRILWGAYVNEAARDILERLESKPEEVTGKAASFLRDALKSGPRMAAEVIAEGEAAGVHRKALQRALKKLKGSSEKSSFGTGWIWELPEMAS
jgi:putative DNA primase/helicase